MHNVGDPLQCSKSSMSGQYVVQKIVGKRIKNGSDIQYKVKWKGYDSSQNTWEPIKHLKNVNAMIKDFEKRNQQKLSQFSINLRESAQMKSDSLPKKTFGKKGFKKQFNTKSNKEEQKRPGRQSVKNIKRNQTEENHSPQKSKLKNRKDSESDVQEITSVNEQNRDKQEQQTAELKINLDSIATKILNATKQKQKQVYEITGIVKTKPGQADLFLVQDSLGQQSTLTREYILKNLPLELIAFYQKQITFPVQTND